MKEVKFRKLLPAIDRFRYSVDVQEEGCLKFIEMNLDGQAEMFILAAGRDRN